MRTQKTYSKKEIIAMLDLSGNICPVCKSKRYIQIDVNGSGGYETALQASGYGYTKLNACLECGCVYLPEAKKTCINEKLERTRL